MEIPCYSKRICGIFWCAIQKKVGPELIYCDDECYLRDCIEKHPGNSLANIVARIRPDLAITKECESGQFTFKL